MTYPSVAQEAIAQAPLYPFLSQPPPQKQWPVQPLPPLPVQVSASPARPLPGRRRSATIAAITAWRADVHPGTPAACSPRRSPVSCRRASLSRRPSLGSGRGTPGSVCTITPSVIDPKEHDFAALGYTSFCIRFPGTPISPELLEPTAPPFSSAKRTLRPIRSLASLSLKPLKRARSARIPSSPQWSPAHASADFKRSRALSSAAIAKGKKSKYAKFHPAPLSNDLALAQLLDGGSTEYNVKRYARKQAKADGAVKVEGQLVGVGDVWRDGAGGVWRDQDEEMEFAHLLGDAELMNDWVRFGSPTASERRDSVSTQDSDLHPSYAMDTEADVNDDLASFSQTVKPGLSVLAIPARSRRSAKHLRKPEFLLGVFPAPCSPQVSPASYAMYAGTARPKGKARRRPAPLTLAPVSPARQVATNPDTDEDALRADFLVDSFRPRPRLGRSQLLSPRAAATRHAVYAVPRQLAAKPTLVNMRGFLKATLGSRKVCAA
ncbi:hypothetical protein PsYK624_165520 [Phanerochaete sordida]|uniref:Uncharacterized protein n=1 Tax=Phanerochaete sordida TaxID=48140 RepID=A0A9P3GRP0_9APHY|nr:hypothetical protein PsYK624_165520 [Phanerochaete sordida]